MCKKRSPSLINFKEEKNNEQFSKLQLDECKPTRDLAIRFFKKLNLTILLFIEDTHSVTSFAKLSTSFLV